jgi:GTPase SAR1 family protein
MVPTIGLEVKIISVVDIMLQAMHDGGRSGVRAAVQKFSYRDTYGLIFVVDSTDRERIDEARDTLHQLLNEEGFRNKPILIFANKQDLSNSMSFDELRDKLNLTKLDGNTKWHLQPVCATQNEDLQEGLKWLGNSMAEKFDLIKPIIDTLNDAKTIKKDLMSIFNRDNLKVLLSKFVYF